MFKAVYSIGNDYRYPGKFETLVETKDVTEIENMIGIQHYPYSVTVHSVEEYFQH